MRKRTLDKEGASMRRYVFALAITLALAAGLPTVWAQNQNSQGQNQGGQHDGVPRLDHVFVIVLENHNSFTSFGSNGIMRRWFN